jgi:hypothetical protein
MTYITSPIILNYKTLMTYITSPITLNYKALMTYITSPIILNYKTLMTYIIKLIPIIPINSKAISSRDQMRFREHENFRCIYLMYTLCLHFKCQYLYRGELPKSHYCKNVTSFVTSSKIIWNTDWWLTVLYANYNLEFALPAVKYSSWQCISPRENSENTHDMTVFLFSSVKTSFASERKNT